MACILRLKKRTKKNTPVVCNTDTTCLNVLVTFASLAASRVCLASCESNFIYTESKRSVSACRHRECALINPGDYARSSQPKPPLTLQSVHDDAIKQLQDAGRLSAADYERIEGATLQEVLASVDNAVTRNPNARGVFKSLLERLGKFENAIDMLVQSSPQILGLSLVGLIWGSLKIFLVVSRYLCYA
jgi:hypothetical protein